MHSRIDTTDREPSQKKNRVREPASALRGSRHIMSQAQLRCFFEKNTHPQVTHRDSSFQYHRAKPQLKRSESFIVHVDKKNHDVMEIYVLLAVAKEINRVHLLGIAHEDLNDGNLLCKEIFNEAVGCKDYFIQCIDFGNSSRIIEGCSYNIEADIDALADFVQKGLDKFSSHNKTSDYACLNEFNLSLLDSETKRKPTIPDFITKLTAKLADTDVSRIGKRYRSQ